MIKLNEIQMQHMTLSKNNVRILSHTILCIFAINLIIFLSGCQAYTDKIRQQNICRALSRQYTFQQMPATSLSPVQYRLCGNNCFPCHAYTRCGTTQPYLYQSVLRHHYFVKHKFLKKPTKKNKEQKNEKNSPSSKINTNPKDNLLNGKIFLSPVKHSDLSTVSNFLRKSV